MTVEVLAAHLREQGRLFGDENDLALFLPAAVERNWESAGTHHFNDGNGGGWFVDLSSQFDGEVLTGVVRPAGDGVRRLVDVLDADRYDVMMAGGEITTQQTTPGQLAAPAPAPAPARDPESPNDLILIIVRYNEKIAEEAGPHQEHVMHITREEVPGVVKMLISQGLRLGSPPDDFQFDVSERDIEIWSKVSKPKVEVLF